MKGNSMTKVKDMAKESCILQPIIYGMKAIGNTIKWMEMVKLYLNLQMKKNYNHMKVNLRIMNSMATEFTQT